MEKLEPSSKRHRKPAAALNLALTDNVLLALIPSEQGQPLAHFFELYHRQPSRALQLILNSYPILWVCQSNALMKTQSRSNLSLRKSRAFKFNDP